MFQSAMIILATISVILILSAVSEQGSHPIEVDKEKDYLKCTKIVQEFIKTITDEVEDYTLIVFHCIQLYKDMENNPKSFPEDVRKCKMTWGNDILVELLNKLTYRGISFTCIDDELNKWDPKKYELSEMKKYMLKMSNTTIQRYNLAGNKYFGMFW